jgi:hypothetical protein
MAVLIALGCEHRPVGTGLAVGGRAIQTLPISFCMEEH